VKRIALQILKMLANIGILLTSCPLQAVCYSEKKVSGNSSFLEAYSGVEVVSEKVLV